MIFGNNVRVIIKLFVIYKWIGGFVFLLSSDLYGGDIRLVIFYAFRVYFYRILFIFFFIFKEYFDMEFFFLSCYWINLMLCFVLG